MKVILSLDVEGELHNYIHSPYIWHKLNKDINGNVYNYSDSKINAYKNYLKWKINNNFRNYAKHKEGFENILDFLKRTDIFASLNLCGYLYLKKPFKINVEMPFAIGKLKKDKYFWKNFKKNFDFCDLIQKYRSKKLDFGLHGFIHEAFPLEKEDIMNLILKKSIESARDLDIDIKTFVPPFNMAFNNNEKGVLDILRKNKINTIRVVGHDNFFGNFKHERKIQPPEKKSGINIVHLSSSLEGNFNELQINEIIEKIISNYRKDSIFCMMSHDYTNKTQNNLFKFYNKLEKLKENYEIKFTNLNKL